MGWDVKGKGRDGRRRGSGTAGVRGADGGGRRRTDMGGGWFMAGNGVSPYRSRAAHCAVTAMAVEIRPYFLDFKPVTVRLQLVPYRTVSCRIRFGRLL